MSDKETIISLLNEFANPEKMASFFNNNATSDFLFIRPSGNPINAEGFEKMIGSLPKLIALLMVLLLVGSTFVGGIIYFIK